jgi:hypothetical protein
MIRVDFSPDSRKIAFMLFPLKALSLSIAPTGDEGSFPAFNTIGINTTHTAVRGT